MLPTRCLEQKTNSHLHLKPIRPTLLLHLKQRDLSVCTGSRPPSAATALAMDDEADEPPPYDEPALTQPGDDCIMADSMMGVDVGMAIADEAPWPWPWP